MVSLEIKVIFDLLNVSQCMNVKPSGFHLFDGSEFTFQMKTVHKNLKHTHTLAPETKMNCNNSRSSTNTFISLTFITQDYQFLSKNNIFVTLFSVSV